MIRAAAQIINASESLCGPPSSSMPRPSALVYCGPGAGARSVISTLETLKETLRPDIAVDTISTQGLLQSDWQTNCFLLVMPGGADLPYCKHLNGRGTALIKQYVLAGGAYLGLCAGAYFACHRVEFEPGTELEVVGDRELGFFPGIARGSVYKGFQYEGEGGAVAAPVRYRSVVLQPTEPSPALAAVAPFSSNTTSTFIPVSAPSTSEGGLEGASLPVLGAWQECRDYVNGGPMFLLPDGSIDDDVPGVSVLATYPEHSHAAAAVLCQVGRGRAVLCGSHPELNPSWLGQSPGSQRSDYLGGGSSTNSTAPVLVSGASGGSVDDGDGKESAVERLQAVLAGNQEERIRYWCSLLVAAGLKEM